MNDTEIEAGGFYKGPNGKVVRVVRIEGDTAVISYERDNLPDAGMARCAIRFLEPLDRDSASD